MRVKKRASTSWGQREVARGLAAVPLLVVLALWLIACGGGDDGAPGPTENATLQPSLSPSPGVSPVVTQPSGTQENCPQDVGPPAEGLGGPDLKGRIAFVRLVFGCSPEIYTMKGDGSGATNVSNHPALDDEPDLSPDGSRIVFFSQRDGGAYLYVVNRDGSNLQRLTFDPGGDASPRWSPDGSRIAFSRGGSLAVMTADGSDIKTIMESQPAEAAEPCRAGSFVGGWSPDGARLTYYSAVLGNREKLGRWYICAIDADGSDLEVLVSDPLGSVQAEPAWSPDGSKIAFRSDRDSSNCKPPDYPDCTFEIYVLDLESGEEKNISNNPSIDIEPNWSPDGAWIIFASNRDDANFDLYAMHPDGSDVTRLLADPGAKDSYPSWVR